MSEVQSYPPVIELFRTPARRQLVRVALSGDEEWLTKKDLAERVESSRESIRKQFTDRDAQLHTMENMGIFEVRDPDANIPHYRPADTVVLQMLREYHDGTRYPLWELFQYTSRQDMVLFFLEAADPNRSYSKNEIHEQADVHYDSVTNHIDALVDASIVEPVEGKRGTEYQAVDSKTRRFVEALNRALVEQIESTLNDD